MNQEQAHKELTRRAAERVTKGRETSFAQAYALECEADMALYQRAVVGAPDPRLVKMAAERVAKVTKE